MKFLETLRRWFLPLQKAAGDFTDILKPRGYVELTLIHATGPKKGKVARRAYGRNVVTGFLSNGDGILSGRDVTRRLLVPAAFAGSLSDDSYRISIIELGSGNAAEASSDTELNTAIAGSRKVISAVTFDATNTYVTFFTEYSESEANTTIREAALHNTSASNGGDGDFLARKTFGQFLKTNEYILQVRWAIRI